MKKYVAFLLLAAVCVGATAQRPKKRRPAKKAKTERVEKQTERFVTEPAYNTSKVTVNKATNGQVKTLTEGDLRQQMITRERTLGKTSASCEEPKTCSQQTNQTACKKNAGSCGEMKAGGCCKEKSGDCKQKCGDCKQKCGDAKQKCGDCKEKCGDAKQKCGDCKEKCGDAKQKCGDCKEKCGDCKEKCGDCKEKCGDAKQKCCDAKQKCGDAKQKCCDAKQKCGDAKQKCGDCKQKCGDCKEKCGDCKQKCGDAKQKCGDCKEKCGDCKQKCGDCKQKTEACGAQKSCSKQGAEQGNCHSAANCSQQSGVKLSAEKGWISSLDYRGKNLSDFREKTDFIIVVDGKEITDDAILASIKSSDIASMELLQGEKAIEKYGERGKKGVLLLKTHQVAASEKAESDCSIH